ncbi:hypothetical protein J3E69DRAFT_366965 [Trichoderma sp. SZMC 28015]
MQCSSTRAVYDASGNGTKPRATSNGPSSNGCSINRFLADQEQRCPPEFAKIQSSAEAEVKMMTKLLAFEKQFSSSDRPLGN